ncbi:MAG: AAA family ATPase [Lachnospiraceae bacterium]|nr:AAA family ATPase [Lachnospiraceae bacterium]
MAKIIALAGKGGVGKTTICSAFVRILGEIHPTAKILAIDADPAVGLSTALGITPKVTLDDIRREVIEKAESGAGREALELLGEVRFRIFDALVETEHFSFLAIGRPEGAGCYCAVNAYLKEVIDMISKDFDYVVIDGEAGIEQINRRVMEKVTHLYLVTDASKKGFQVAQSIKTVADELVMYEKCGMIVNRAEDPELIEEVIQKKHFADLEGISVLTVIPNDQAHARNDVLGENIFELPCEAPVYVGARKALELQGL